MANMFQYLRDMAGWVYRWPPAGQLLHPGAGGPLLGTPVPFYLGYEDDYTMAMQLKVKREQVVIATGIGNSSTADTSFLTANSIIMGGGWYVDVTPGGSPTMSIGDATQTARFVAAATSSAAATKGRFLTKFWDPTVAAATLGPAQSANAALRFTFGSNPSNALGRIRVWVAYWELPEDLVALRAGP